MAIILNCKNHKWPMAKSRVEEKKVMCSVLCLRASTPQEVDTRCSPALNLVSRNISGLLKVTGQDWEHASLPPFLGLDEKMNTTSISSL